MTLLTPNQKQALKYDGHLSLTANAGSGKTFVLSRRFIEIILNEDISLRNIAAITFTEKAASELYKKIASQIDERIVEADDKKKLRKLESIRRQLVSANISTIHSFCIDILREYPVEAGLDANFSPIDEQMSTELIELSVDEMIKSSINKITEDESLRYLVRFFNSKLLLAKELISLIKNRKNVLKIAGEIYQDSETSLTANTGKTAELFEQRFEELFDKIFSESIIKTIDTISQLNSAVLEKKEDNIIALYAVPQIDKIRKEKSPLVLLKQILSLKELLTTKAGSVKNRDYAGKLKDEYACEISEIESFFSDISELMINESTEAIEAELAKFGNTIIYFFKKALGIYEAKKKENGYLDYEDILLITKNILEKENVRHELSEKFKYIMIDEYQDTNEIQYNIFLPILDELKKGNLFIVGDEKQSIYMFRDAELEIFSKTKSDISEKAGEKNLLTLPDSFRMAPAVSLLTNKLFRNLFNKPNRLYNEVEYSELVCARNDDETGRIEILIPKPEDESFGVDEDENNEEANEHDKNNLQAELVAKRILQLISENELTIQHEGKTNKICWKDIAVLCRKRSAFTALEKSFTKFDIPFSIVGGKGFYQRQPVYDVYNYFSFLLDIKNDTALIGILRSPLFSISDSEIFEVSLMPGKTYWDKLREYSKKNSSIIPAVKTLNENVISVNSLDIVSMLRKILNESGMLSVLASKRNGVQETANIDKLVKVTIKFLSQGFRTLYDYVNFLKDSIESIEDESQALVSDEIDSVKIMTLHQAKGLEFPAVFLFKCDEKSRSTVVKTKAISVNKELGLMTKVPVNQNYFEEYQAAPIVGISNIISKKKNIAEIKRLLYVGITRAVNYLFITADYKEENKYDASSFMGMIVKGLSIDLNDDQFQIKENLNFLHIHENEYKNFQKELNIRIPIIREIPQEKPSLDVQSQFVKKGLKHYKIDDEPEGEIISATKIAVFKQCPVKYQLTYEYGFNPLFSGYKRWLIKSKKLLSIERTRVNNQFEFSNAENKKLTFEEETAYRTARREIAFKIKSYSEVKGRIIHKLLEENIHLDNLADAASALVKSELREYDENEEASQKLADEITGDLKKYFNSVSFKQISNYEKSKNEFEIYVKENNYFLYGIIDKLIFEEDKAIIVDYKTDDISADEIDEKAEAYLTQLRFYACLVKKYFNKINEIELRLIFIKHPEKILIYNVPVNEIELICKDIYEMVGKVRKGSFIKNLSHCPKCNFAIRGNCIKRDLMLEKI